MFSNFAATDSVDSVADGEGLVIEHIPQSANLYEINVKYPSQGN